jgi:hypothetical protein
MVETPRQSMLNKLLVLFVILLPSVEAQKKTAFPRLANGKPNLTGVWQGGSTARGTWEEANSGSGLGGTGLNPSAPAVLSASDRPADREPAPYQPSAAAKVMESYKIRGIDDPTARCLPAGIPRTSLLGLFPTQIVQTPEIIVILYEYMNASRVIHMNEKHPDDLVPSYMGDSVGHWEGDTLVVDITGFNDKTWLVGTGTFHTDKLHVVERYTRIDKDQIKYDVTMEDPGVLTKPWVIHSNLMLREGTRVQEYICVENNLDPGHYEDLIRNGIKFTRP